MSNFKEKGRLTRDFTVRKVGDTYISESCLAYNSEFKNKKTGKYDSNFINIQVWGESFATKSAQYYKKGSRVLVEGFLSSSSYVDKQGNQRTSHQVTFKTYKDCELLDYVNTNNGNNTKEFTPTFEPSNDFANNVSNEYNEIDTNLNPGEFSAIGDDEDIPF